MKKIFFLVTGILSWLIALNLEVSGEAGTGFCMGWNDTICNESCCKR
jgi:hypothetical protein